MVEVVGLVERALEEFLKEDVELWEIIILCNSSLYSLSGSGWKTRLKDLEIRLFVILESLKLRKPRTGIFLPRASAWQAHCRHRHQRHPFPST